MPSVFGYQDYRKFLADFYGEKKTSRNAFSYQNFSRNAGFASKSFVFNVIKGRKNLSRTSVVKMCEAMGLKKGESIYFENLVYYNQARNFNERNFYFEKLNSIHPPVTSPNSAWNLRKDQYEFYSNWYHAVIRSLMEMFPKITDPDKLSRMVYPAIKLKQAKKSIDLLLRLGLISGKKNGTFKVNKKGLTTGEEVKSLAVQKFHVETMKLAERAIKSLPPKKRNISGLTLGISGEAYDKICDLIYKWQEQIMEVANNDEKSDRVYQLNFHLFPVSKLPAARNGKMI